jgi:hypothetical protein
MYLSSTFGQAGSENVSYNVEIVDKGTIKVRIQETLHFINEDNEFKYLSVDTLLFLKPATADSIATDIRNAVAALEMEKETNA